MALLQDGGGGDWWDMIDRERRLGSGGDPQGVVPTATTGSTGIDPNAPTGQVNGQNVTIDQLKQLIGNDYSAANLTRLLPQLQAMGIEVQNQGQVIPGTRDLRPRFRLPNGEQWDFGGGGWINSAHNIGPGFNESGGLGQAITGDKRQLSLENTPGYKWTLGQGLHGVEASAFAKGAGLTGGTLKALMQYGSGLASQTYGDEAKRQYDYSRLGLDAILGGSS